MIPLLPPHMLAPALVNRASEELSGRVYGPAGGVDATILYAAGRTTVTATSLGIAQLALGERDYGAILARSLTGAVLAEMTALSMRAVQAATGARPTLDLALLATYGPREFARITGPLLAAERDASR
jgi:hypothetical protein